MSQRTDMNFYSLKSALPSPLILVPGTPVHRLSFDLTCWPQDRIARRKSPRKGETKVKKLIFASLLSVGALLVTTTPIFAAQTSATKTTSKKNMKKHHKKSTKSDAKK